MSSSSDEDVSKFKEATDVKLFNDALFSEDKGKQNEIAPAKPSQRYLDVPDENRINLKVTPGFQKHVASRLMKILDSSLDNDVVSIKKESPKPDDSKVNESAAVPVPETNPKGGIKLFGASAAFLASCDIQPPSTKRRKRGRKFACISSDSEGGDSSGNEADLSSPPNKNSPDKVNPLGVRDETDLSERFAACAVSSEWILNGNAVKGWAPPLKNKEPIEGEATFDLHQITVSLYHERMAAPPSGLYKRVKAKRKSKKERKTKEERKVKEEAKETGSLNKKRGKRGGLKKKKSKKANGDVEEGFDDPESITKAPKKKKRRKEALPEDAENASVEKENERREIYHEIKRALLDDFIKKGGMQGTSDEVVDLEYREKKKKNKKKRSLRKRREKLDILIEKVKSCKKESQPVSAVAEDEGFASDPIKTEKRRTRRLLKGQAAAKLKKQRKSEKKWRNKMEYLSNDLANLVMTNIKQD